MRIHRRSAVAGLAATFAAGRHVFAEPPYPARPIRVIAPSTPGGPYDITPRLVADYISRKYGWTIVTENRPGASGIVGMTAAKQAPPDGYTLVVTSSATHGSEPAFKESLPYDPSNDFAPIILLAQGALVLLVGKKLAANSVADLIALIRARPGTLKYSSSGHVTQQHLAVVMMLQRQGLPIDACTHVPYRGILEAVTGLLAGEVDFMIVSTGVAKGHINNGDLRALAITTPKRSARLPNVPTFAELGYDGYQIIAWCGLSAPAHTAQPVLDRWNAAANEALMEPSVRKRIDDLDYDVCGGTAESYTAFFTHDIAVYRQLAEATGLRDD